MEAKEALYIFRGLLSFRSDATTELVTSLGYHGSLDVEIRRLYRDYMRKLQKSLHRLYTTAEHTGLRFTGVGDEPREHGMQCLWRRDGRKNLLGIRKLLVVPPLYREGP